MAAAASKQKQIPTLEKATIWLYSEVLPKQAMSAEHIAEIVKAIALSQNTDVPEALVQQTLLATQVIIAQYGRAL